MQSEINEKLLVFLQVVTELANESKWTFPGENHEQDLAQDHK